MLEKIIIVECPRDGIQGLKTYIPAQIKADYINSLLNVGFDIIDVGSFVSPKVIPQLSDTYEVLNLLDISHTSSKLMILAVNLKGAEVAVNSEKVSYLSYPFSISPAFLKLNLNSDFEHSLFTIEKIHELCQKNNKKLKVYITMAFGNPYNDECNTDIILNWVEIFSKTGINYITLSDVTGLSNKENIAEVFSQLVNVYSKIEFGFHLHTKPDDWFEKVDSAFNNGCRSFDSVINGMGGCPMTNHEMVGNLSTENLLSYFNEKHFSTNIDRIAFDNSVSRNKELFNDYVNS